MKIFVETFSTVSGYICWRSPRAAGRVCRAAAAPARRAPPRTPTPPRLLQGWCSSNQRAAACWGNPLSQEKSWPSRSVYRQLPLPNDCIFKKQWFNNLNVYFKKTNGIQPLTFNPIILQTQSSILKLDASQVAYFWKHASDKHPQGVSVLTKSLISNP